MGAAGFDLRTVLVFVKVKPHFCFTGAKRGLNLVLSKSEAVLPGSDEHNEPNWLSSHLITLLVTDTPLRFWTTVSVISSGRFYSDCKWKC
jgi:hypothetical protein